MGSITDIANQDKRQTFPDSQYQIIGNVPLAQCTASLWTANDAWTTNIPQSRLWAQTSLFGDSNLAACQAIITSNPGGNTGTFGIISNIPNRLILDAQPGEGSPTEFYIQNNPTYSGDDANTSDMPSPRLIASGPIFGTQYLVGCQVTITSNPGGNTGTFGITANTSAELSLDSSVGNAGPATFFVHSNPTANIPRNIQTFAPFISAAGYAYTVKGSTLYTNMPTAQIQNACPILFAPLT